MLFVLAGAGVLWLGLRIVAAERAVAERTARERLSARAREGAGRLVTAAVRLLRRAAVGPSDAVAAPDGSFVDPPSPRALSPLPSAGARDPEGAFYLAAAARAEVADGNPDQAAGLYRAAAREERDVLTRLAGLYRLAALERRRGDEAAAARAEAEFLDLLPPDAAVSQEALIVRARGAPDDRLRRDLLAVVGSEDEPLALGLLAEAGLLDAGSVAARRRDLDTLAALAPLLDRPGEEGAAVLGARLAAFTRDGTGNSRFALGPMPALPAGVSAGDGGKSGAPEIVERVAAGPPFFELDVTARVLRAEVAAEGRRGAMLLLGALAALLVAGGAALFLSLRAARRETAAARERAAFVTKVGHDLRTPLALVRMYAETLEEGRVEDPKQAREFAGIAAREARRLTKVVGDALDLTRAAAEDSRPPARRLDLAALVREVADAHRPLATRAGLALEVDAGSAVPVRGDAAALRGAVANLIENAIRHAGEGERVDISCRRREDRAEVRVADRGPGIPAALGDRIFERFVRGPDASGSGAGLGLALVREVAGMHEGEVAVESRDGGGAEFVIRLPGEES